MRVRIFVPFSMPSIYIHIRFVLGGTVAGASDEEAAQTVVTVANRDRCHQVPDDYGVQESEVWLSSQPRDHASKASERAWP
jgi:hypothetical protein